MRSSAPCCATSSPCYERRIADVMVHIAPIIVAVKREHSARRTDEACSMRRGAFAPRGSTTKPSTDPEGMVHIRDLVRLHDRQSAAVGENQQDAAQQNRSRQVSTCALSISRCRLRTPHPAASCCMWPPSMRGDRPAGARCRPPASIWRWWSTNTAHDGLVTIEDIVEQIVGRDRRRARQRRAPLASCGSPIILHRRRPRQSRRCPRGDRRGFCHRRSRRGGRKRWRLSGVACRAACPLRGEVISGPGNFEVEAARRRSAAA